MNNLYIIKDRLNEALQVRNMSRSELAEKSGINKGTISRYLRGETIPRSLAIGKLAQVLNVNPAWILGYDVSMDPDVPPIHIEVEKLSKPNFERLLAYYQALIDSQGDSK